MTISVDDFEVVEHYDASRVEIRSRVNPLSLQAKGGRKQEFQSALAEAVRRATTLVFTHDVEITLTWLATEDHRYKTNRVADLDDVLKPLLDAVTGPDGVMIDDNQVQSIRASWMTPGSLGIGFELSIEPLLRDDRVTRGSFAFVDYGSGWCYFVPVVDGAPSGEAVDAHRQMISSYEKIVAAGILPDAARAILPLQRPFPRARLGRFTVFDHTVFPVASGDG